MRVDRERKKLINCFFFLALSVRLVALHLALVLFIGPIKNQQHIHFFFLEKKRSAHISSNQQAHTTDL